jgi:hypothetical protein
MADHEYTKSDPDYSPINDSNAEMEARDAVSLASFFHRDPFRSQKKKKTIEE